MNFIVARPYRAHLVALLVFTLLAVGMTVPLAFRLSNSILATDSNALNDSYFSVWIFGWQAHQLIADPLNLFQGNIFYPFPNSLAFSEVILPGALLYLPFDYATGNPIFAYNLVLFLTFPLNAFAMYLWTLDWFKMANGESPIAYRVSPTSNIQHRTSNLHTPQFGESPISNLHSQVSPLTPDSPPSTLHAPLFLASLLSGVIFAFCTYKMGELRHIQLLMSMFMPLTLMYLARFMRTPNPHNGILTALFFALNALSSLYYALFLAFGILLYLGMDLVLRRFRLTRRHLLYGIIAFVITGVLVMPFLLPFLRLEREFNFSEGRDPRLYNARPASYIATPREQWLYGDITRPFRVASKGQPLFPGIAVLVLSAIGTVALVRHARAKAFDPRMWVFAILLGVMGFVLSFGPDLLTGRTGEAALNFPLPYFALAKLAPPLNSLNAPSRFVVLTMLALSLLAAYGVLVLMRRAPRRSAVIALVCGALIVAEYIPVPLRLDPIQAGVEISPVYRYLAAQPRGQAVVELPMGEPTFVDQDKYVVYAYNSLYHLQPLVNGYSTFIPPDYYALVTDVKNFPDGKAVKRLRKWGVQWLVVHSERYKQPSRLRKQLSKRKNIRHVLDDGDTWLYRMDVK